LAFERERGPLRWLPGLLGRFDAITVCVGTPQGDALEIGRTIGAFTSRGCTPGPRPYALCATGPVRKCSLSATRLRLSADAAPVLGSEARALAESAGEMRGIDKATPIAHFGNRQAIRLARRQQPSGEIRTRCEQQLAEGRPRRGEKAVKRANGDLQVAGDLEGRQLRFAASLRQHVANTMRPGRFLSRAGRRALANIGHGER